MVRRFVVAFLWVLLVASPVLAWNAHGHITALALADWPALAVEVSKSPYTYGEVDTSVYNPMFVIRDVHPDVDRVTALDILVGYADEPDWDLDTHLELSPMQRLTGGSQGWRHQRYSVFANGWLVLGVAHERAEHFYRLALHAYREGDSYWGWRFLARSLHYLQDMGQPFHALPMPVSHLFTRHRLNVSRATIVGENYHFNLEAYVEQLLLLEVEPFVAALAGENYVEIKSVRQAAIDLNVYARQRATPQYELLTTMWPSLATTTRVNLPFDEESMAEDHPARGELWQIIEETLAMTAAFSRGLVHKFLADTARF